MSDKLNTQEKKSMEVKLSEAAQEATFFIQHVLISQTPTKDINDCQIIHNIHSVKYRVANLIVALKAIMEDC